MGHMQIIKTNKARVVTVRRESINVNAKVTKKTSQFDSNWLNADATVLVLAFLGWTIPSATPTSGFGGSSLFSKFLSSIAQELAQFPKGPALTSDFWLTAFHVVAGNPARIIKKIEPKEPDPLLAA